MGTFKGCGVNQKHPKVVDIRMMVVCVFEGKHLYKTNHFNKIIKNQISKKFLLNSSLSDNGMVLSIIYPPIK